MSTHEIERPAAELLQELRDLSEHERIEAKRASSIQHSIMETVCAFCNEPDLGGGWLLLGVEEDDSTLFADFKVVGVDNMDKLQNDLQSQCRSVFNAPVTVRMRPEKVEGQTLLKVFVPEVDASAKPIYFQKDGLPAGAFRRVGSSDVHCSEEDLAVLYAGRSKEGYDSSIVKDADWDDFDGDVIAEYRRDLAKANPTSEILPWSDEDMLHALGCVAKENGQLRPTVAGILLFGSKMALRRLFPMMRVDYIRVPGKEWIPDPENRFDSIDMRDPLMRMARRAQNAIRDDLIESFSLPEGEMQRQTQRAIPDRVIREAVVNALVHRSYQVHSPIQIIRYSNRLEIRNVGYSLKSEDHLGAPGSQSRNPKLAAAFHETHFAENKGSGVRVMREKMREAGLTPPFFESSRSENTFTARFLFHHFLSEADVHWLTQYKSCNLSDADAKALIYVREQGAINNAAYRDLNVTDTLAASKHLKRLCDVELLVKKGKSTSTYYVAGPKFLPLSTPLISEKPIEPDGLTPDLTPVISGKPMELDAISMEFAGLSMEFSELPVELQKAVKSLQKRATPQEVRALIQELCSVHAWRLGELAILTRRNAVHLRHAHLTPLIKLGLLEYLYPEAISHPQQAYRAARSKEN